MRGESLIEQKGYSQRPACRLVCSPVAAHRLPLGRAGWYIDETTHLNQLLPIAAIEGETRHLQCGHGADFAEALECAPAGGQNQAAGFERLPGGLTLELHRTEIAERGMKAFAAVDGVDEPNRRGTDHVCPVMWEAGLARFPLSRLTATSMAGSLTKSAALRFSACNKFIAPSPAGTPRRLLPLASLVGNVISGQLICATIRELVLWK